MFVKSYLCIIHYNKIGRFFLQILRQSGFTLEQLYVYRNTLSL